MRSWIQKWWLWTACLMAMGVAGAFLPTGSAKTIQDPWPEDRSVDPNDEHIASRACRSCHADTYNTWYGSYHRTMTQKASPEAIVADWTGELQDGLKTYQLLRDGDKFLVNMPKYGTDGTDPKDRVTREVVMSTGSHHMQIYWVPVPWAGKAPNRVGAQQYDTYCIDCHGPDSEEPLTGRELTSTQISKALARPAHASRLETPPNNTQLQTIQTYLEQLQVMGNLQQFPFAWWIRGQRWIHEEHTFLQPPQKPQPVEIWEQRWSDNCDQCHSVGPQTSWREDLARLDAGTAELGIACEACHGPAREHTENYRNPVTRYSARLGGTAAEDITHPGRLDHERASAICGNCHGELVFINGKPGTWRPGERLEDHVKVVQRLQPPYPKWLAETLEDEPDLLDTAFWKDGTMRVAGRDYNAMVLSGCYTQGEMSCMSCHQLHGTDPNDQLKPGHRGDAACSECHPVEAAQGESHTHHPAASEGSRCMNCHMPHTTLGLLGAMRSHRIDSPNATTAETTGRPDACSLCHLDKPLSETAETLTKWYGQKPLSTVRYTLNEPAASILWYLKGDAAQRALIGWHMGWAPAQKASGTDWMAPYLSVGMEDDYSAVRYISGASLRTLPGFETLVYDYTKDSTHLADAADRVMNTWKPAKGATARPALLMTPEPDWDRIETYLLVQDKSPVSVSE